jgi:homoserine O-acetyltransferase
MPLAFSGSTFSPDGPDGQTISLTTNRLIMISIKKFAKQFSLPLLLTAYSTLLFAQNAPSLQINQNEQDFVINGFAFRSGGTLPELKIHYVTFGTPHKGASGSIDNAVLLLHGTTGTSKNFFAPSFANELYGEGQPLDARKFFIIVPDGIGLGGSGKPSDGLHAKFPKYGYLDMVEAQYRLVTEGLHLSHLKVVLGTSMGGMQTWLWGELHPEFMDALMPIASLPMQVSGRNYLWRRVLTEAIRQDPDWHNGDYTQQPRQYLKAMPVFNAMIDSPIHLQKLGETRENSAQLYDTLVETYAKTIDANNILYRFEASYDYDPTPDLGKIRARLYAVNFADDELNPIELGVLNREVPRIPGAKFVNVPPSPDSLGHQSLTQAARWKVYLSELLRSLEQG